jgi:endosialidase-like protein
MTRSTQSSCGAIAVLALAAALLAAPATAGPSAVAAASVGPLGIQFQPSVEFQKMTLTVSGPEGLILRREFAAGAAVMFEAIGDDGKPLPDGAYRYELVASPVLDRATRRALAAARQNGDDAAIAKLREAGKLPSTPMIQSGSFSIAHGTLVQDDAKETPRGGNGAASKGLTPTTSADQVIPDDLIVQGSLCVGLDCVNNENFGFDTIRLKENNTRIHFDDTSTSAGFPANDWRLIANDSASGGSSKFSIEDSTGAKTPFTITAGAATNSIFADSTGRIGLRTSTPVLDLHINTSNTPAIRLEQNNSGGFTAQTWDIGANEANFFVRDVTGGSKLSLRIRPGAPTSSVDISADGDVGIGTGSPEAKLHVFGSNTADTIISMGPNPAGTPATESAFNILYSGATAGPASAILHTRPMTGATAPNPSLRFWTNDVERMIIDNEGFIGIGGVTNPANPIQHSSGAVLTAGGQWTPASTRKVKQDIRELSATEALDTLQGLNPVKFEFKVAPDDTSVGFIAEDVPELVAEKGRANLNPMELIAVLAKVVQEQEKTIDELSAKVAELEKQK